MLKQSVSDTVTLGDTGIFFEITFKTVIYNKFLSWHTLKNATVKVVQIGTIQLLYYCVNSLRCV